MQRSGRSRLLSELPTTNCVYRARFREQVSISLVPTVRQWSSVGEWAEPSLLRMSEHSQLTGRYCSVMVVARTALLVLCLFVVAGCSQNDSPEAAATTTPSIPITPPPTNSNTSLTVPATAPTLSVETTVTQPESSGSVETTATQPANNDSPGSVLEPGDIGSFASPSRNILCMMSKFTASCFISVKQWTIDQPDAPGCAESDWGNVIDLSAEGVSWPCYTDFGFDFDAPVLAYGDAIVVGEFRCDSVETGVTCRNASGHGFTIARAEVKTF